MIDVTKTIAPSTALGMDMIEKADEYRNKAKQVFIDPVGFIKDEVKNKIAEKVGGLVDIDGAVDADLLSAGAATALKATSDFALGTDDPSKIAGMGIEWGVAQITKTVGSADGSDIAFAESGVTGMIPSTVISMGGIADDINVVLPKGDWDIKTVTKGGKTKTTTDVNVPAGVTVEIEEPVSYGITIVPSSATGETGSSVSFYAEIAGPHSDNISFIWDFGDGSSPMSVGWDAIMSKSYTKRAPIR